MSFSRYSVEKKQVSTDRGIHWEDYTPAETRRGNLVGVARTLLECEDMACDLEKYEYRVVSGELTSEICGEFNIPEGIVKTYTFTAGAVCCTNWISADVEYYDYILQTTGRTETGVRICGGGYCPSWGYYQNIENNGMSLKAIGQGTGYNCVGMLYPCITINSFMPWAEGKENWQVIEKQHYVRPHCSDPWEVDGEPEIIGVGERWQFLGEDFYTETWQHQVASSFDASGNVLTWDNVGTPTVTYYDSTLPEGFEIIDELRSDDVMLSGDLNLIGQTNLIQCKRGDYSSSIGGTVMSSVSSRTYNVHNKLTAEDISGSSFTYYKRPDPPREGQHFAGFFYDPIIGYDKYEVIIGPADILRGISTGLIRVNGINSTQNKLGTLFPYRIPEPAIGMEDDYWNGTEYGYVRRDGTSYPIGYVAKGYYVDSSGNTNHISSSSQVNGWTRNTDTSDAVSFTSIMTSIPNYFMSGHASLSSVTLTNTTYIGGYAFAGTTSLHSIAFPDSLTTIDSDAFNGSGLSAVTLNNVSTLGTGVFINCSQLESIDFGSGLTEISNSCFSNDIALSNVVIPSNITRIGHTAFAGCDIKCLTMVGETPPALGNDVFSFNRESIILVPASAVDTYKSSNGWADYANIIYPVPNETEWVKIREVCINGQAYNYCHKRGRNTDYSDEWFWLPEYDVNGEPQGECSYEEIEYIFRDENHTGLIADLGVILKEDTRFEIKFRPTNNGGGGIVYQNNAPDDDDDYRFFWYWYEIIYDYGNSRNSASLPLNNTYELEIGNYYIKHLYGDYIINQQAKSGVATSMERTLGLFGSGDYGYLYYLKVYEGDRLVKYFVPAIVNNQITLYDIVDGRACTVSDGVFGSPDE